MNFTRCKTCVMPNTRPDTPFVDGECQACINYRNRPNIDWDTRRSDLVQLLEEHNGYCIVPSSGGKDSHAQVHYLQTLGAKVTCVTATTCHLTPVGRANIDNLARYADTIEVTPNRTVRRKLNRLGLELVGDISWPEHVSIFTAPFNYGSNLGRALMFYGENPQAEYGGPQGSEKAREMTRRWVSEFGGFLGLRPADMVGQMGITEDDMRPYMYPSQTLNFPLPLPETHFLGAYLTWDSRTNAQVANEMGMRQIMVTPANWWLSENQDNAQTGLHDHGMYRKYGFGRGCQQISVDVRTGRVSRDTALEWVREHDGLFPHTYADIPLDRILEPLEISEDYLFQLLDKFTNWDLFAGERHARPLLRSWT